MSWQKVILSKKKLDLDFGWGELYTDPGKNEMKEQDPESSGTENGGDNLALCKLVFLLHLGQVLEGLNSWCATDQATLHNPDEVFRANVLKI